MGQVAFADRGAQRCRIGKEPQDPRALVARQERRAPVVGQFIGEDNGALTPALVPVASVTRFRR